MQSLVLGTAECRIQGLADNTSQMSECIFQGSEVLLYKCLRADFRVRISHMISPMNYIHKYLRAVQAW